MTSVRQSATNMEASVNKLSTEIAEVRSDVAQIRTDLPDMVAKEVSKQMDGLDSRSTTSGPVYYFIYRTC